MTTEVSTTQYEFSHGKKPRGAGYWGFQIGHDRGAQQVWLSGTYSEAKRLALKVGRRLGASTVEVLP